MIDAPLIAGYGVELARSSVIYRFVNSRRRLRVLLVCRAIGASIWMGAAHRGIYQLHNPKKVLP